MPTNLQPRRYYEEAISKGGVVQWHDGRTIYKVEDLPTDADLAAESQDAEQIALAEAKLLKDKEELDAKLAKVRAAKDAKQSAAPVAVEPADDKDTSPPKSLSQPPAARKGA